MQMTNVRSLGFLFLLQSNLLRGSNGAGPPGHGMHSMAERTGS